MRPDRAVVKKAIDDAKKNLSRAAALLGCTRQSLYTWIYQHGLADYAGIRMDRRHELDERERMDTRAGRTQKEMKSHVYAPDSEPVTLRLVETATAPNDLTLQVSMKLPESLWQRVKIEAIRRRCTMSQYVRAVLECALPEEQKPAATKRKKGEGGE